MPPEPILPGEAKRDTVLPTGGGPDGKSALVVRKGQTVVLSLYGSHRNPATFGRDAADFRPERWDGIINDPPGYAPFSTGPRSCMGRKNPLLHLALPMKLQADLPMMQNNQRESS